MSHKKKMKDAGHMFHCLSLEMRLLQNTTSVFSESSIWQWVNDRSAQLTKDHITNPWTFLIQLGARILHNVIMEFLTHNSNIFSILADILISYARDCTVRYIKGLPGTGKTYSMAFAMIVLLSISKINILWTSAGNAAVSEASKVISHMLQLTPTLTPLRGQIIRLLATGKNPAHLCDFTHDDRRSERKVLLKSTRMVLCTTDMAKNELLKQTAVWAPGREVEFQLAILDEAQQNGDPSDLIVRDRLFKSALVVDIGDDRQPPMLVDPANAKMVRWADHITGLGLGIRDPRIVFVPSIAMAQHLRQLCAETPANLGPDPPIFGSDIPPSPLAVELQSRIDITIKIFIGSFGRVRTVAAATSRGGNERALLLSESRRSPPGMAAFISLIAYRETIVPTSRPSGRLPLGETSDSSYSASWQAGRGAITDDTSAAIHALRAGEGLSAISPTSPNTFIHLASKVSQAAPPSCCPA
jgi:hypothetical protein